MNSCSATGDRQAIVVIGGNADILRIARDEDIDVELIHDTRRANFDPALPGLVTAFHDLDFLGNYPSVEAAVLESALSRPPTAVVSLDEDGLLAAARLNAILGLAGNSVPAVYSSVHKPTMRKLMRHNGVPTLEYRTCTTPAEFAHAVAELGGDVVAKPVDATGSRDVHYVDPANAPAVWSEFARRGYREVLVEQRARGAEFSVDTLTIDRNHLVLAITRKHMIGRLEAGHSIPGDLGHHTEDTIALVFDLLDCLGIVTGPAHTEVMITDSGPAVIETQSRIGGSRLPELMRLASGIEVTRLALLVALRRLRLPGYAATTGSGSGGAAVRYFLPPAGRIVAIRGAGQFEDRSDLRLNFKSTVGDTIVEQTDSHERNAVGMYVVASGSSEKDAIGKCEEVLDAISFEIHN
ncbi:ATP-grasp domain-containing protein [Nocardia panacis]|uniref:ATP-grasp domain-containing protein n=1 Tax=Nocardia panacis TaxID=2340916 RepID=A0A3A4KDU3_9NOCA|nr:ATP-grasp domain-containing protein [Nocardia panacis]RJO70639.1 ATP-grasp domain-containing protein [Nocardia panacis]